MQKSTLIAILVVCLFGTIGWLTLRSVPKGVPAPEEKKPVEATVLHEKEKIVELVNAPRPPLPEPKAATEILISKECRDFWTQLRSLALGDFQFPMREQFYVPPGEHCPRVPMMAEHTRFLSSCGDLAKMGKNIAEWEWRRVAPPCMAALVQYRAKISDFLSQDQSIESIDDPKLLLDKLMARFTTDYELSARAAERLLELQPDLDYAAMAASFSRFMDARSSTGDTKKQEAAEVAIRRLDEMGHGEKAFELRVMMARSGDVEQAQRLAEDFNGDHPNSGRGFYHLAWIAFDKGDVPQAKDWLQKALRVQNLPRYQEALLAIEKGEAQPFKTDLSFTIDPT